MTQWSTPFTRELLNSTLLGSDATPVQKQGRVRLARMGSDYSRPERNSMRLSSGKVGLGDRHLGRIVRMGYQNDAFDNLPPVTIR